MYEEKKQVLGISNQEGRHRGCSTCHLVLALHLHIKTSFKGVPRFPFPAGSSMVLTLP